MLNLQVLAEASFHRSLVHGDRDCDVERALRVAGRTSENYGTGADTLGRRWSFAALERWLSSDLRPKQSGGA